VTDKEVKFRHISARVKYQAGQVIFKEGSFGEAAYIILSGELAISVMEKGVKVTIGRLGAGDILGQISFVDKQARSATAEAVTDVELGVIDRDFLDDEMNRMSEDFRVIMNAFSERLRKSTSLLINVSMKYLELKNKIK
jgi:CRP-like cAMP-binding protein